MSARVRVRNEQGRTVAVKVPARPGDAAALAHEATMLAAAAHPGVVELCSLNDDGGQVELVTIWAGGRSLADVIPLPPASAAAVVAALATTVADVHDLGIVHGRLDPTHVVLDDRGRPLLCGFAAAGALGEPRGDDGEVRRGADDVAGLGAILTEALGPVPADDLVPDRRFRARRSSHHLHRSLLVLADRATVHDPSSRPTARALAASIQDLLPERSPLPSSGDAAAGVPVVAVSPATAPPDDSLEGQLDRLRATAAAPPVRSSRRRAAAALLALVGALVGVGVVVGATSPGRSGGTQVVADVDESVPRLQPAPAPSAAQTSTTIGRHPVPTVEHAGRIYAIGDPGDVVAVADWRCEGTATVAVLRPPTGDVFVFDAWAEAGADLVAEPVGRVAPGSSLLDPPPSPCPPLRVRLPDGSTMTMSLPEESP